MTAVEETENLKCQTDFDNNCNKINEIENDELNAKLSYQDIGGLSEALQKIKQIMSCHLHSLKYSKT
jgi:ATP-dependent 26S proteasome regulatory subunit